MCNRRTWLFKRFDIFLIFGVSVICLIAVFVFNSPVSGTVVTVYLGKNIFGVYPLSEDRTVEIDTEGGHNSLVIENGSAYMKSADCGNKDCVRRGAAGHIGESIICVPNGVIVKVEGTGGVDAVSY